MNAAIQTIQTYNEWQWTKKLECKHGDAKMFIHKILENVSGVVRIKYKSYKTKVATLPHWRFYRFKARQGHWLCFYRPLGKNFPLTRVRRCTSQWPLSVEMYPNLWRAHSNPFNLLLECKHGVNVFLGLSLVFVYTSNHINYGSDKHFHLPVSSQ